MFWLFFIQLWVAGSHILSTSGVALREASCAEMKETEKDSWEPAIYHVEQCVSSDGDEVENSKVKPQPILHCTHHHHHHKTIPLNYQTIQELWGYVNNWCFFIAKNCGSSSASPLKEHHQRRKNWERERERAIYLEDPCDMLRIVSLSNDPFFSEGWSFRYVSLKLSGAKIPHPTSVQIEKNRILPHNKPPSPVTYMSFKASKEY